MKKKVEKTRDERVVDAKGRLSAAQDMFTKAQLEVEASNRELDAIEEETKAQMAELQATLDEIAVSKEKNNKFHAKMAEFTNIQ
jgi:DNA repair ATPase RecN